MATFTELCCRSGGNNLNAGTVDGGTTEPATTPLVTYTGGDWNSTTDVYTAPVGADMTEAVVGRFASVYVDGDTVPTTNQFLIGQITAVNAGARTVTLSPTLRMNKGTEVTTGTGTRSMRIGGAWVGPAAADTFPLQSNCSWGGLVVVSQQFPRINFKNNQTYTVSASCLPVGTSLHIQGYTTAYGDGGRATFDGGTSGAAYHVINSSATGFFAGDLIILNNGATGGASIAGLNLTGVPQRAYRITVHDVRGIGIQVSNADIQVVECEAYACNQSGNNQGGFHSGGGSCLFVRCISHNTGGGTSGFFVGSGVMFCIGCVAHGNASHGFFQVHGMFHCDAYDNGGSGASLGALTSSTIINCNFLSNGAHGIASTATMIYLWNCGFGTGTQVNVSGNFQTAARIVDIGTISYATDVTPWTAPNSGNFTTTLAAAINAGRGAFLQSEASQGPTVGYPDIGAAEAQTGAGGGSTGVGRLVGSGIVH